MQLETISQFKEERILGFIRARDVRDDCIESRGRGWCTVPKGMPRHIQVARHRLQHRAV